MNWESRAAAITAAMLGVAPNANVSKSGGWQQAWHEATTAGLDVAVIQRIARVTGWTPEDVCSVAVVPACRCSGAGTLDPLESERVARVAWIAGVALVAVDGSHAGRRWFAEWTRTSFASLDGHAPITLMQTTAGSLWLRNALDAWLSGAPQ